eukprot:c8313_g1_i4.p1 GENE.c8313_g1_i4~~c8313_g1_i4.p1  ORF type:complete len:164 (-),score=40.81 c8313_g1_i4:131-622(-)
MGAQNILDMPNPRVLVCQPLFASMLSCVQEKDIKSCSKEIKAYLNCQDQLINSLSANKDEHITQAPIHTQTTVTASPPDVPDHQLQPSESFRIKIDSTDDKIDIKLIIEVPEWTEEAVTTLKSKNSIFRSPHVRSTFDHVGSVILWTRDGVKRVNDTIADWWK